MLKFGDLIAPRFAFYKEQGSTNTTYSLRADRQIREIARVVGQTRDREEMKRNFTLRVDDIEERRGEERTGSRHWH